MRTWTGSSSRGRRKDSPPTNSKPRSIDFVNQPDYQPVKPRGIAHRLGLPKEEATEVRRAVKRLVRQGKLAYGSNHLVRL